MNLTDTQAALDYLKGIEPEHYPATLIPDTDPLLSRPCYVATDGPEGELTAWTKRFVPVLKQRLKDYGGAGLAAPQVGIPLAIIALYINGKIRVIVNPTINSKSVKMRFGDEGCLSYPHRKKKVARFVKVQLVGGEFDDQGVYKHFDMMLEGLDAVVAQHEVDHTYGITLFNGRKQHEQ